MKTILILGAGKSTAVLIHYLLDHASEFDWHVVVADLNEAAAKEIVRKHPRGEAVGANLQDNDKRVTLIRQADIVINMLTRPFQHVIAVECLHLGKHMLSASYEDPNVGALHKEAMEKGILILNELGLDPGIDHMSGMNLITRIHDVGGTVQSFRSYGGGLPAPESADNPLRYVVTWNPRNVLMAGEDGAMWKEDGKIYVQPFHEIFRHTWPVQVNGLGTFEAYPNRDSLSYINILGVEGVHTMVRGTLRYTGWSETWQNIVKLGLTNEVMRVPNLANLTYAEMLDMFIPPAFGVRMDIHQRVAHFLGLSPTGNIMANLQWLGLFEQKKIGFDARTVSQVMIQLIQDKMRMPPNGRDMVILQHEIEASFKDRKIERITSTMIDYGKPGEETAIARTVGLPAAIAAKLVATDQITLRGCFIPTKPEIYKPILAELVKVGIHFEEKTESLI